MLGAGHGWLVANVQSNLERQNINSGFGFLSERAGFGINQTLIDYSEDSSFARVLTVGLEHAFGVGAWHWFGNGSRFCAWRGAPVEQLVGQ